MIETAFARYRCAISASKSFIHARQTRERHGDKSAAAAKRDAVTESFRRRCRWRRALLQSRSRYVSSGAVCRRKPEIAEQLPALDELGLEERAPLGARIALVGQFAVLLELVKRFHQLVVGHNEVTRCGKCRGIGRGGDFSAAEFCGEAS